MSPIGFSKMDALALASTLMHLWRCGTRLLNSVSRNYPPTHKTRNLKVKYYVKISAEIKNINTKFNLIITSIYINFYIVDCLKIKCLVMVSPYPPPKKKRNEKYVLFRAACFLKLLKNKLLTKLILS